MRDAQVERDTDEADHETDGGAEERKGHVVRAASGGNDDDRGAGECGDGVEAGAKDRGDLAQEDVSEDATADPGDCPENNRFDGRDPVVERGAGTGDAIPAGSQGTSPLCAHLSTLSHGGCGRRALRNGGERVAHLDSMSSAGRAGLALADVAGTPLHTTLLTHAARAVLRPLGVKQKGRSRLWLDDHGWWVGLVEFQPSGWSRGSYLNVGVMWLWHEDAEHFHYDVGHRIEDFVEFESEAQFAPAASKLAETAKRHVQRYRGLFADARSAASHLESPQAVGAATNPHHHALDAGIAWAVAGDTDRAAKAFDRADAIIESYWDDWTGAVAERTDEERAEARQAGIFYPEPSEGPAFRAELEDDHAQVDRLRRRLSDVRGFRAEVTTAILTVRERLKLPQIEPPFDDWK